MKSIMDQNNLPLFIKNPNDPNEMSIERIKNEIAFRESGISKQPYSTIGPTKDLGKYQVNPQTLASYGKQFLGRDILPQEFLANPDLQEKFMDNAVQHIGSLGAKSLDAYLALWHKGWGDVSSSRVRSLKSNPDVVKYLNNQRKPQLQKSQPLFISQSQ